MLITTCIRDVSQLNMYDSHSWKGCYFVWKVYERGTFSVKNGIQKGKGLDFGAEHPPVQNFVEYPTTLPQHKCNSGLETQP